MSTEDIKNNLYNMIKETYKIADDDDEFTTDVHLFDYGYIDSFGAVDLISRIEKTYGIEITNKDLMQYSLNTINEIAEFVDRKVTECSRQ